MNVTASEEHNYVVLQISERIDSATAEELEKWISTFTFQPEKPLIIDFSELDYISSAGLRVIFNLSRELKKTGCTFAICNIQDYIREIFEISGFDAFIPIYKSREDFLNSLSGQP